MATPLRCTLAVLYLAASACGVTSRLAVSHAASTTAVSSGSVAPESNSASGIDPRFISGDQVRSLHGLTVEQATTRLRELGVTGKITVEELSWFAADCKEGTVCKTNHDDAGMVVHEDMVFGLNKAKLGIAPPP